MEIDPLSLPWNSVYKIFIGAVLPRPIGWISTVDPDGHANLAPFSFFNAVCPNPPTVMFCPMIRQINGQEKDSLANARSTGEFVVNIVTAELAAAMNASAVEASPDLDEFVFSGLTPAPSVKVRPPRVAESPIQFECRVDQIVDIGNGLGSGSIVIGRVVHMHIDERVLQDGDKINLGALHPIGRLAGNQYCRVTDIFEMVRPQPQIRS